MILVPRYSTGRGKASTGLTVWTQMARTQMPRAKMAQNDGGVRALPSGSGLLSLQPKVCLTARCSQHGLGGVTSHHHKMFSQKLAR